MGVEVRFRGRVETRAGTRIRTRARDDSRIRTTGLVRIPRDRFRTGVCNRSRVRTGVKSRVRVTNRVKVRFMARTRVKPEPGIGLALEGGSELGSPEGQDGSTPLRQRRIITPSDNCKSV